MAYSYGLLSVKYGLLSVNYGLLSVKYGLLSVNYGLLSVNYGLLVVNYWLLWGYLAFQVDSRRHGLWDPSVYVVFWPVPATPSSSK